MTDDTLREALIPFVRDFKAAGVADTIPDDMSWRSCDPVDRDTLTVGDFRRAAAALNQSPEPTVAPPVVSGDMVMVRQEAQFLCDRLREFEEDVTDSRLYWGHVQPSLARLETLLEAAPKASPVEGEKIRDRLQAAWDSWPFGLPPIDFTDAEAAHIAAALSTEAVPVERETPSLGGGGR